MELYSLQIDRYSALINDVLGNLYPFIVGAKGQLISKCPFGVFKSSKKPTIFFAGFLP